MALVMTSCKDNSNNPIDDDDESYSLIITTYDNDKVVDNKKLLPFDDKEQDYFLYTNSTYDPEYSSFGFNAGLGLTDFSLDAFDINVYGYIETFEVGTYNFPSESMANGGNYYNNAIDEKTYIVGTSTFEITKIEEAEDDDYYDLYIDAVITCRVKTEEGLPTNLSVKITLKKFPTQDHRGS